MTLLTALLRERLISNAEQADRSTDWPIDSWWALQEAGVPARSIPVEFGGAGCGPVDLLRGMEEITSCCMTTAFALSQREAAVRHLLRGPSHLKQRYLPMLASGEAYVTVGLSQLTTSRQHMSPALRVTSKSNGGYVLNGEIPWVTGADQAAAVVVGATLPEGDQLLVLIPAELLQGMIQLPLSLAALVGSRTSLIRCHDLFVPADFVLNGPIENVLGKLGGGGLDTSCLAIGLASAATEFIRMESELRPDMVAVAARFESVLRDLRSRLHELAESAADPSQTLALRLDCTKLALRAAQASLMVAKGNGFVAPHPAQRWARQAMFFLVWSCPKPVAEGVLSDLIDW